MQLKASNKKCVIKCIIILIFLISLGIYSYINTRYSLLSNAYIDIWRDTLMDPDIDLYSIGGGINQKLYLGAQPLHYIINKNGKVYTYKESSYRNMITGITDFPTIKYIKKISKSDFKKLENDLNLTIKNNNCNSPSINSKDWFIKIKNKENNFTRVNINVERQILDKYL